MVIREPSGLGSQHLACTGVLMGSGRGSFVGRWHQDSITYPKWPLLIQKHPAGLRLNPPLCSHPARAQWADGGPRGIGAKEN